MSRHDPTTRVTAWIMLGCLVLLAPIACHDDPARSDDPFVVRCPDGYTEWSAIDEPNGPPVPLEEALRRRLAEVPVRVAPEAVDDTLERARTVVIGSIGSEAFEVEAVDGTTVTILLDHTSGGFLPEGARWCAPDAG